jgi:hypothetical protein
VVIFLSFAFAQIELNPFIWTIECRSIMIICILIVQSPIFIYQETKKEKGIQDVIDAINNYSKNESNDA